MVEDQAKVLIAGIIEELRRKYLNPMAEEIQQTRMEFQATFKNLQSQMGQISQKIESIYMTQMNLQTRVEQTGGAVGAVPNDTQIQELSTQLTIVQARLDDLNTELTTIQARQDELSTQLKAQVSQVATKVENQAVDLQELSAKLQEASGFAVTPSEVLNEQVATAPSVTTSFDLSTPRGVILSAMDTISTMSRPAASVKGTADERGEVIAFRTKIRNELERTSAGLADLGVGRVKTRTIFTSLLEFANRWDKLEMIDDEAIGIKAILKKLDELRSELGY
ncbi:MAG: hypothetical protein ACFFDT_18930 [Candidatus Hodarchaeota archaeon]